MGSPLKVCELLERDRDERERGRGGRRRIDRAEGVDARFGRGGDGADPMEGLVERERGDRRAVQVRRDGRGRARDGVVTERVMDRMHRRLDREDRDEENERGHDQSARAPPHEPSGRQQSHERDRPGHVGLIVYAENSEGSDRFRGGRELRGLEDRALDTADMGVGRGRSQQRSGHGDDRQHAQHEPHSSEETCRTQCQWPIRYTDRVYALGLAGRWLHLTSSVLLVGAAAMIVLAGRSDRATAQRWERTVLTSACWLALVALASGIVVLATQTALFEGRGAAAFEPRAIGRVLVQTQAGRRFSRAALGLVLVLAATGTGLVITHVGNVAGLVGTTYGRLLLAKLALLILALSLAALNRSVLLARLGGDGPTVGRPAMRRLAGFVTVEAGLALAILVIVAAMNVTPPARHEAPVWPFTIRLSFAALEGRAAEATRALIGSQIGVIGLVALITGLAVRAWRLPLAALALIALGAGAGLALPPLTINAYPPTYLRPSVPYQAGAITAGAALYQASCAGCHGARGAGDGPDGRALPRPPADLRAPHTAQHTAGDLFWWISHGIPGSGMPGFGPRLTADQRWDLLNFRWSPKAPRRSWPPIGSSRWRLTSSSSSIARATSAPSRAAAARRWTWTRWSPRSSSSTTRRPRAKLRRRSTCTDAGLEGRAPDQRGARRRRGLGLRLLGPAHRAARAPAGRGEGRRRERHRAPVDGRRGRARHLPGARRARAHARRDSGLHARDDHGFSRRVPEDSGGRFRGRRGTIYVAGSTTERGGDHDREDQVRGSLW